MFKKLLSLFFAAFTLTMYAGANGLGRFDSIGGTYDEETTLNLDLQMYYEMRNYSLIADLSNARGGVGGMHAYPGVPLNPLIKRVRISQGDMIRLTMEEAVTGMVTYGDMPVVSGGFLQFKNMEARVNQIDSPAFQVVGQMSQQRVRPQITDLPGATKRQALTFMREQLEYEAIPALLQGASPGVLNATSSGGLGASLGVGSGAGAGVPLVMKNVYTTDEGFMTYDTTPATWNSDVNDAINGIDAAAADQFTLAQHNKIRAHLDDIHWEPAAANGKRYKAIAAADPDIMWRLAGLLDTNWAAAAPRSMDNPVFNAMRQIELDEILYFSWPNLKKYRPAYNGTTSRPDFGPVTAGSDPRTYTTTSSYGMVLYLGGNALVEGYNDQLSTTVHEYKHGKGWEVSAHMKEGFVRSEWYAKDGRTDSSACENVNSQMAVFYEPGVGESA